MKYINLETYPRRSHYEYFKSLAYPYVGLTANVDVTGLIGFAREREGSTFLACLWAAANAANAVPELRQRIVGNGIVEFDHCDTAHTVALPDKTFCALGVFCLWLGWFGFNPCSTVAATGYANAVSMSHVFVTTNMAAAAREATAEALFALIREAISSISLLNFSS